MRIRLEIPLTLKDIAFGMKGDIQCQDNPTIEYVSTDSREIKPGDLFIPLMGDHFNGENYVSDILSKGCFAVSEKNAKAHIRVENTRAALLNFASFYNKTLPYILYRVGITGSVGKTTTKEFLKILLSAYYKTHANEGNLNNEIGLPLSLLSAPLDTEALILEMGMNHRGEIGRLSKCLCPNAAIITNIGSSHIGNLGSKENIAKAKIEILEGMTGGKIYVPMEEKLLQNIENKATISLDNKYADFYLASKNDEIIIYKNGYEYITERFAFKEKHLQKCLLFACALATDIGVQPAILSQAISSISKHNIRQTMFSAQNYLFYADFYNASPESILASFDSIKNIEIKGKKHLLLGDVLELGEMSEEIHYKIGKSIPKDLFAEIFLFGDFAEQTMSGAISAGFLKSKIHTNPLLHRPDITAMQIKTYCSKGDLILMKASRGIKLERVLSYFM